MKKKTLTKLELGTLRRLHTRLEDYEYRVKNVEANMAFYNVPSLKGEELLHIRKADLTMLQSHVQQFMSRILASYGFTDGTKCTIDLDTGEIKVVKDESGSN